LLLHAASHISIIAPPTEERAGAPNSRVAAVGWFTSGSHCPAVGASPFLPPLDQACQPLQVPRKSALAPGLTIPFASAQVRAHNGRRLLKRLALQKIEKIRAGHRCRSRLLTRAKDCSPGGKVACRDMVQGARWENRAHPSLSDEKFGTGQMRMLLPPAIRDHSPISAQTCMRS
jgi:hypothetical protein